MKLWAKKDWVEFEQLIKGKQLLHEMENRLINEGLKP